MNPHKVNDEVYINFVISTPKRMTATETEQVQPESKNSPAHGAFTRPEPDAETLFGQDQ